MADDAGRTHVFRVPARLYACVGALVGFFVALGLLIGINRGMWGFLGGVGPAGLVCLFLLRIPRLEIRPDGFTYRNLSGRWTAAFTAVERAYFEVVRVAGAPGGVAAFWVRLRDGKAIKVNLRTFPLRAAAHLFAALERHGVRVEVPEDRAVQGTTDPIRAERSETDPDA